jgi:hypothetical protein
MRPASEILLPSVSRTAPVHRGFLELELLHQEIGPVVEVIERGAGPVRGLAGRRIAVASRSDPFASAEHIAGTNGFLGIGRINRAWLIEAPRPGLPAAHFSVRLPFANCLSANWEYTVRMPSASTLGLTVSHATVARFGPFSTLQVQIARFGLPGSAMHGADVQSANSCWQK